MPMHRKVLVPIKVIIYNILVNIYSHNWAERKQRYRGVPDRKVT